MEPPTLSMELGATLVLEKEMNATVVVFESSSARSKLEVFIASKTTTRVSYLQLRFGSSL